VAEFWDRRLLLFDLSASCALDLCGLSVLRTGRVNRFLCRLEVMAEPDCADAVPVVTRVEAVEASASDNGAVLIEVETWEARREIKRLYRYVLYPGLPMTGIEWEITSAVVPLSLVTPRLRHEDKNAGKPEF